MKLRTVVSFLFLMLLVAGTRPGMAARPDPTVAIDVVSPAAGSKFMPGDSVEVQLQVTDPNSLVRRVFVRLVGANGAVLNANQEAPGSGGTFKQTVKMPLSARPGPYTIQVEALGDEAPLQWTKVAIEVQPARFAVKVVSPAPKAVFSRNESFDVVIQADDPKRKTRRVFVEFEDTARRVIINANREAVRKGDLWTQRLSVPPTATPGTYRVIVRVYGEGRELLSSQVIPVGVALAPVHIGDLRVEHDAKDGKIHPGDTVRALADLQDPRGVIRRVLVTCTGPDNNQVLVNAPAERRQGVWAREVVLDPDCPPGTYVVEVQALGQSGEIISTRRLPFTVVGTRR